MDLLYEQLRQVRDLFSVVLSLQTLPKILDPFIRNLLLRDGFL